MKSSDIYANLFSFKYNNLKDIDYTKSDLVIDSFILSDFQLVGPEFYTTALLQAVINGISLLPCLFLYAMLMNEFTFIDIVSIIQSSDSELYMTNNSLLTLNLIALVGFAFTFLSNHSVSFELGKPGDKSKLKQLFVILGAPLFTVLFIYAYIFN